LAIPTKSVAWKYAIFLVALKSLLVEFFRTSKQVPTQEISFIHESYVSFELTQVRLAWRFWELHRWRHLLACNVSKE